MNKNLHFFGCSVTAGNELWEEANIPNYRNMTFDEAKQAMHGLPYDEVRAHNKANSFPQLVADQLGVPVNNHGIPGISNKEIASRSIAYFPEDHYEDTVVFLQFTTHNRMFLRYKETGNSSLVGSFVVHHKANDDRLTKGQSNLLREMFFEFFNETIMAHDDHVFMYYAAQVLKDKGITPYIIWPAVDIIDWGYWDKTTNDVNTEKEITIKNDVEPQFSNGISRHLAKNNIKYNILRKTLSEVGGENAHLPRYHFSQNAHINIANTIVEKLKNV